MLRVSTQHSVAFTSDVGTHIGAFEHWHLFTDTKQGEEINTAYSVPWQQAKQMDDDALAIMQGKPMFVPGEEGLRDIRIVEAIYKSAASGKEVRL